jgi:signal transduction histidine kinase
VNQQASLQSFRFHLPQRLKYIPCRLATPRIAEYLLPMFMYLFTGIAIGILITIPIIYYTAKRTATRVRQLENRAQAVERLAELGTMTGGLAHEIKNPLSTVGLNIQLLQEDVDELGKHMPPDDSQAADQVSRLKRRLSSLGHETHRLKEILEDFLRFAGRMKLDLIPENINDVIEELTDFFRPQASMENVQLRTQLDADPATLPLDQGLFKQAVLNLMINANTAMSQARAKNKPHGGANELLLRTRNDAEHILVNITDTGPGIPPEVLSEIFKPYFSTTRGGTGLGLPTTRRIVEEHGGTITCHSDVGRGTSFVLRLPIKRML